MCLPAYLRNVFHHTKSERVVCMSYSLDQPMLGRDDHLAPRIKLDLPKSNSSAAAASFTPESSLQCYRSRSSNNRITLPASESTDYVYFCIENKLVFRSLKKKFFISIIFFSFFHSA